MPGNLNNNDQNDVDKQKDNNNNNNNDEDLQEDEDEKVSRKAKQHAAAAKNRKLMLRQNLHQNHFEHETSMFEKSSSNKDQLIPTIKGLHIEDIGKDIQKIHQLLVDTADTEHGLNGKASSKIQESAFSSSLNQNTILTEKRQPSLLLPHSVNGKAMGGGSKKATRSSSKAQVSDPSRPVYTTSNQVSLCSVVLFSSFPFRSFFPVHEVIFALIEYKLIDLNLEEFTRIIHRAYPAFSDEAYCAI